MNRSQIKILGICIDIILNFEQYTTRICKPAANQLNALIRLKQFLRFKEKMFQQIALFYRPLNILTVRVQYKLNLNISRSKQVAFETKNLGSLGPKTGIICLTIQNQPKYLKVIKNLIKNWGGSLCSYVVRSI